MSLSNGDKEVNEVLRLRGLPWSATAEDIVKWFGDDVKIRGGAKGVHLTLSREGRPSGEAYVAVETNEDIEIGVKKDQEHMGHRYIEVFRTKLTDMAWKLLKSTGNPETDCEDSCIRLRGLPYECSKEEIIQFFGGMEIVPNGISLMTDFQGRSSGEAYVQFVDRATAERALDKHKEKIGHRYIEIFRSTMAERDQAVGKTRPMFGGSRPGPYDRFTGPSQRGFNMGPGGSRGRMMGSGGMGPMGDRGMGGGDWGESRFGGGGGPRGGGGGGGRPGGDFGFGGGPMRGFGGTGHRIHMRGIPFRATEEDIAEFFRPLNPVNIKISFDKQGRASGEADVDFACHEDAVKAMKKDKENMQHRYIELFLDSMPGRMDGPGGMGGRGMGRDFDMGGGGFGRQGGMGGGDDPMDDRFGGDRFGNNRFGGGGGGGSRFGGDNDRFGGSGDRFNEDRFGGGGNRFGGDGDRFGGGGGDRFGGNGDRFGGGNRFGGGGDRFDGDGDRFGGGGNRFGGGGDRFGDGDRFGRGGDRRSPDRFSSDFRRMGGGDNMGGGYNQRGSFDDSGRGNFGRDGGGGRFGSGNDSFSSGRMGGDDSFSSGGGMRNYGGGSGGGGNYRTGGGFGDSGRSFGGKGDSGFGGGSSDGFGSMSGRDSWEGRGGGGGGYGSSNSGGGGNNWGPMEGSRW